MKYLFLDSDFAGIEDYNIKGNDYIELISTCISYSYSFSFIIIKDNYVVPEWLNQYRMPLSKTIIDNYCHYFGNFSKPTERIYHLRLEEAVCIWIFSVADNIFDWNQYADIPCPEDPLFLRKDGSVFFSSIIHEGECTIYPRENEDISSVISKGLWHKLNDKESLVVYPTHPLE